MRLIRIMAIVLAVVGLASVPANAWVIYQLVPWSTINGGGASTSHFGHAEEGNTSYHQLTLSSAPRITRVDNLNGVQTMTQLVSTAQWTGAGGTTSLTTWYGFGLSGDYVQFTDTSTDEVWRVHKSTGAITKYASKASIMTATGLTTVALLSPSEANPVSGEMAFYEGDSDKILITNGQNNVSTLVSDVQLQGLQGNDTVSGGLGYTAGGDLYWGSNDSDSMYKRASDGTLGTVLTTAQVTAVSGGTAVTFKDIFAAPDGWIYWQDGSTNHLLRFLPGNPAGTLEVFITSAQLSSSVFGTTGVVELGWWNEWGGCLTANRFGTYGLYVIPEPASLALLALGGLMLARRRR